MEAARLAQAELCQNCAHRCRSHIVPVMRALICDDYTGIDGLRVGELPDPEPGAGQILVKVESAAVNFADVLMVRDQYQFKPDPPFAPGYEVAGTVIVANGVDGFSPGDRVAGFALHGAMAEKIVLASHNAAKVPDNVDSNAGCTIPAGYGTSYHGLVDRANLQTGETLLVLGASGGVGMAAVQIGTAMGARVIAAVSSAEKAEAAMASGADDVIRYDQLPLREALKTMAPDGVDVVYDPVGGDATEQALRSTKWNGRLLVVGFAGGEIPAIPLNIPLLKGNSVLGVFWGRFSNEEPEKSKANFETLMDWAENGTIVPQIQKTYSLDQGAEALHWLANRRAIGRVVINP